MYVFLCYDVGFVLVGWVFIVDEDGFVYFWFYGVCGFVDEF